MNTFSLNPTDGRTARRAGVKTPTATERLIVFRGRKYLAARSLSLPLDACNYWQREGGRRRGWEWTVGRTLPLYNGPENARIRAQIYGQWWPHRGREGTIANLRCLVWSIAAERRVPRLGMRSREGGGSEQQAVERSGGQREGGRPFIAASSKEIGRQEGEIGCLECKWL